MINLVTLLFLHPKTFTGEFGRMKAPWQLRLGVFLLEVLFKYLPIGLIVLGVGSVLAIILGWGT